MNDAGKDAVLSAGDLLNAYIAEDRRSLDPEIDVGRVTAIRVDRTQPVGGLDD